MFSAAGPWKQRLSNAFFNIESLGGVLGVASSSTRFRAQLAMFVWLVLWLVPHLFSFLPGSTVFQRHLSN